MSKFVPYRIGVCAATILLVCACQDIPKYKRSNGKFAEWKDYEGKNFAPTNGTVTKVDLAASTVTVTEGKTTAVLNVTPQTRIMHEGDDITLAQLPVPQGVKILVAGDKKTLISIWYGQHLNTAIRRTGGKR